MAGIILFTLPQVVQVVVPSNPSGEVMITSFHHTRSDFKLFWNVNNAIDFFIRDFDRKIKPIGSETYSIAITNPKSGEFISELPLTVMDATLGHVRLTISAPDSLSYPIGHLSYSVIVTAGGLRSLMFTDRDYGPQSTLEVKYGPLPAVPEPTVITPDSFSNIDGGLRAGAYPGSDASNMRTFIITADQFSGDIVFETSLSENVPSVPNDWFVAHQENFSNLTGSATVNLEGNYAWVRLVLMTTSGSLTQILLK